MSFSDVRKFKKPFLEISVTCIIAIATVVSTAISLVVGVMLYLESMRVLEETMREQSEDLAKTVRATFSQSFTETEAVAEMNYKFLLNFDGTVDELADNFRDFVFCHLITNPSQHGSKLTLLKKPQNEDDLGAYISVVVWRDPIPSTDEHVYLFGTEFVHTTDWSSLKDDDYIHDVDMHMIDKESGLPVNYLKSVPTNVQEVFKKYDDLVLGSDFRWDREPQHWYPTESIAHYQGYHLPKPPFRSFPEYSVLSEAFMDFDPWIDAIKNFVSENAVLLVFNGHSRIVYCHTLLKVPAVLPSCHSHCLSQDCAIVEDCHLYIDYFGPTLVVAVAKMVAHPLGSFKVLSLPATNQVVNVGIGEELSNYTNYSVSTPNYLYETIDLMGGDWYCKISDIFTYHPDNGRVDLIWMKPVSSVNHRVIEALTHLIVCSCAIIIFDVILALCEYFTIARPLNDVVEAIVHLQKLDLISAESRLNDISIRCFGSKEVGCLIDGIRFATYSLMEYKKFLPRLLFIEAEEDSDNGIQSYHAAAPAEGMLTVVFTNVFGSSSLWERNPAAMKQSITTYNGVIRSSIREFDGYEVKTIGDSFMVAFTSPVNALQFGLNAQTVLFSTIWCPSIADDENARWESGVWNGLRVRIGMDYGSSRYASQRDVTGAVDYVGQVVNKASRIADACPPGCICFPDEMLGAIDQLDSTLLAYRKLYNVTLRGCKERIDLHALSPRECGGDFRLRLNGESVSSSHSQTSNSSPGNEWKSAGYAESVATCKQVRSKDFKTKASSTVATITIRIGVDASALLYKESVKGLMVSIDRSGGDVLSLSGNIIVGGWNILSQTSGHVQSALFFCSIVMRSNPLKFYVGVASGETCYGRAGSHSQRFVSAVGVPTVVSDDLCRVGMQNGVRCLVAASDTPTRETDDGFLLRPIDLWTVDSVSFTIFQFRRSPVLDFDWSPCSEKRDLSFKQDNDIYSFTEWGWSSAYSVAFSNHDVDLIRSEAPTDKVLQKVVKNLIKGTSFYFTVDVED